MALTDGDVSCCAPPFHDAHPRLKCFPCECSIPYSRLSKGAGADSQSSLATAAAHRGSCTHPLPSAEARSRTGASLSYTLNIAFVSFLYFLPEQSAGNAIARHSPTLGIKIFSRTAGSTTSDLDTHVSAIGCCTLPCIAVNSCLTLVFPCLGHFRVSMLPH